MYNPDSPTKKQNHVFIIGGLIAVIIIALALRFFIFPGSKDVSIDSLLNVSNVIPVSNKKKIFNADLIKSEKYKNLQDSKIITKTIEEIKFGKEDIFLDK